MFQPFVLPFALKDRFSPHRRVIWPIAGSLVFKDTCHHWPRVDFNRQIAIMSVLRERQTIQSFMRHSISKDDRTMEMPSKKSMPLATLGHRSDLSIAIRLENPRETYTTGDVIQGDVNLQSSTDLDFQDIRIELVGTSRTLIERWTATPACLPYTEVAHDFLRLSQPDVDLKCPIDHVIKAGKRYTLPFTFVVPKRLPEGTCGHPVSDDSIRDAHSSLPPTLGHSDMSGTKRAVDDLSHHRASISYGIFVAVTQEEHWPNDRVIARRSHGLKIIPAVEGLSNLDAERMLLDRPKSIYCTRREETVKGGALLRRQRLGILVANGAVRKSIRMHDSSPCTQATAATTANVRLEFKPSTGAYHAPPQLDKVTTKLRVCTEISSKPCAGFPQHSDVLFDATKSRRNDTVSLAERALSGVEWYTCAPAFDTASPSFETDLAVPVSFPDNKMFVPTFHSCYISRTYSLAISITYAAAGVSDSIDLCLPLQVTNGSLHEQRIPSGYDSWVLPEYEDLRNSTTTP